MCRDISKHCHSTEILTTLSAALYCFISGVRTPNLKGHLAGEFSSGMQDHRKHRGWPTGLNANCLRLYNPESASIPASCFLPSKDRNLV